MRVPLGPQCGSTFFYTMKAAADLIAIPAGAFADTGFTAPDASYYEKCMSGRLEFSGDMRFEH